MRSPESCPAQFTHGNRDVTSIQNVSLTLCPHKVTQLWGHLAEQNNQHTPETFTGYCTGAAGFRELLSSHHLGTQLCAPYGLIETPLPHLCSAARTPSKTPGSAASRKGWDIVLPTYTGVSEWKLLETGNCRRQQKK